MIRAEAIVYQPRERPEQEHKRRKWQRDYLQLPQ